ncbi:hypothetical protein F4802DRAFT_96586 [Xylaria palmicola]|nr:hypothetical protein F4802DRAFT_96586 [Xylaria palmicola]
MRITLIGAVLGLVTVVGLSAAIPSPPDSINSAACEVIFPTDCCLVTDKTLCQKRTRGSRRFCNTRSQMSKLYSKRAAPSTKLARILPNKHERKPHRQKRLHVYFSVFPCSLSHVLSASFIRCGFP